MAYKVSALKTKEYTPEEFDRAVQKHFEAFDIRPKIGWKSSKIVLKPNLLMKRAPDEATTTHPELVAAVVRYLKTLGADDITIADSPGGPFTRQMLEGIYKATGMTKVAADTGAKLNFDTGFTAVHDAGSGGICQTYNIIDVIAQADVVINLPKMKTHAMTTLSGAVKNLFGCIPGLQKPEFHFRFPEKEHFGRMLVELAEMINPQFTIVDAVVSMEGDGPSGGSPKFAGLTIASDNLNALDFALCGIMSLPPEEVCTVAHALQKNPELSNIEYIGEQPSPIEDFKLPHSYGITDLAGNLPPFMNRMVRWLGKKLAPKPYIIRGKCIGCAKCAESCPAHVIDMIDKKAVIRYENCIKCFCCHEFCPPKAIGIQKMGRRR